MALLGKKSVRKKTVDRDIKTSLVRKFQETFIDKLTPPDLEELRQYIRMQYNRDGGWNHEYRQKFEEKLRQYFHEEVLKREIASIETLLGLMSDQDLKK